MRSALDATDDNGDSFLSQNDPVISQIIIDEEELKQKELAKERKRLSSVWGEEEEDLGFEDDDGEMDIPPH